MSKYEPLWKYLADLPDSEITMTFDDVARITGFKFDHSFLTYKKELPAYGWQFKKLSLKNQTLTLQRVQN